MIVTQIDRLIQFGRQYADSNAALTAWRQIVERVSWRHPVEVRATFGTADPAVSVASGQRIAVFNIKGNKYRLIASINYQLGVVNVLRVLTHREYSRNKWKDAL